MTTYQVQIGHGVALSTSLTGLAHIVSTRPPGQYDVFETLPAAPPTTRLWGVAIKHDDGRVELRARAE
jgi:hypothetical protein